MLSRQADQITVFAEPPPLVEGVLPAALADALVAVVALRGASPVAIQPEQGACSVHVKRGSLTLAAFRVGSDVGNAAVARLAKMANLDPFVDAASPERQSNLARVYIEAAGRRVSILIGVGATPEGLEAELFPLGFGPSSRAPASNRSLKRCLVCGAWQLGDRETCEDDGGPLSRVDDDPVPGGVIGPYRVIRTLGDGAMGTVLEAEHALIGRRVAIKLLHDLGPPSSGGRSTDARRFVAEARAATRIRHPNVVEVTDYGLLSDGRPFMVMELVTGRPLADRLDDEAVPPLVALRLAREIAVGLEASHGMGVLHNDLKPSNVMLLEGSTDEAPRLKLIDFGAASTIDLARQGEDVIVGTPAYMAPERAAGRPFDGRADLYALGAILHEMLSGEPPFAGESARSVLKAQVTQPAPEPTSPLGPLASSVSALVRRCLRKSPDERHQSAAELVRDIDAALTTLSRPGWRRWLP